MDKSIIDEVINRIDNYDAEKLVSQLVRIPSENPEGSEEDIAEFVNEKMDEIGLNVKKIFSKPGRPNVIGQYYGKENKPVLMLNGHLDTVPIGNRDLWSIDPIGGIVKEGKVYGRGSADMKGGLASMILAAKALKELDISLAGNLILAMVVDEETTGMGTRDLLNKGIRADAAIVCEGTNLKVHNSHKGILNLEVMVLGKSAHASIPHQGVNAIYRMSKICLLLEKHQKNFMKESRGQDHPTISVGTIQGGIKANVVPNSCIIAIDRRVLPGEDVDKIKEDINLMISEVKNEEPDFKVTVRETLYAEPSIISENERVITHIRNAIEEFNLEFKLTSYPATCDMRYLLNHANISTAIFGPGKLGLAHIEDEYVEIEQVVNAAKIYSHVAISMLK